MSETEKITINLSVVDLGKIDLLVEEGFYSNRTDFIRAAIRAQMHQHQDAVKDITVRKTMGMGIIGYGREALEARREDGRMLDVRIVGMFILEKDVTPDLALATINSIKVHGSFQAPANVKAALQEAGRLY